MFQKKSDMVMQEEQLRVEEKKPELVEIAEELHQTKESVVARIKQGRRSWCKEACLFSSIALVLSMGASGILAMYLKNLGIIQRILSWFEKSGADDKMRETIANPMLMAYSMLYGGENQVYFVFNKMDEYRFTVMLPLFFIGITIFLLWLSEKLRYAITKRTRDMYSNIAIAMINGLVVTGVAFLLSKQLTIRGEGITGLMQDSRLNLLYEQYVASAIRPSLKIISTVDLLRLWGMSFTLTLFTLTFFARKQLVFKKYDQIVPTLIYIARMIFIAIVILALVISGKIVFSGAYMPMSFTQLHLFLETFCFLMGMLLCALLTGHVSFIDYLVDANSLLELKMELFTMEAWFKKNVSYLDNPIGSYFLVLMLLVLGVILLSSFRHWRGRGVRFNQGFAETLVVATILSLSAGLFSRLGAFSFSLDCDTTNRSVNFNHLVADIGATNFWEVATKVFAVTFLLFLLGWALNQLVPKLVDTLGKIPEARWNYFVWISLIIIVALVIVLTINPEAVNEISKMFSDAIWKSQLNILLRLEEVFK